MRIKKHYILVLIAIPILVSYLIVSGKDQNVGAADPYFTQVSSLIPALEKLTNGRYKEIKERTLPGGVKFRIDKIEVWGGKNEPEKVGYQVYITRPDGAQMSFGTGIISSTPWTYPPIPPTSSVPTSTTTSTI